jgi:cytochrome P450
LQSVRLASPAQSLVERIATKDTEVAGTFIPKGSLVKINILGLHYNPSLWNEPNKFNPDRFEDGGELESRSSVYSYLPFGGGSRQCIGMNFSLAEQRIALSLILRRYELSVPEDSIHKDELKFSSNLFLNSALDVKLNFKRRY